MPELRHWWRSLLPRNSQAAITMMVSLHDSCITGPGLWIHHLLYMHVAFDCQWSDPGIAKLFWLQVIKLLQAHRYKAWQHSECDGWHIV